MPVHPSMSSHHTRLLSILSHLSPHQHTRSISLLQPKLNYCTKRDLHTMSSSEETTIQLDKSPQAPHDTHHAHPLVTPFNHDILMHALAESHHDKKNVHFESSGKRKHYRPKSHRNQAAVLLPIITSKTNDNVPYLLLTQRSSTLRSHRSQVAFPGGKMDETDESLWHTALRECHEEIGLEPENITYLGELDPFISRNGILVAPYVGLIQKDYDVVLDPNEVDYVFRVPLAWFLKNGEKRGEEKEVIEDQNESIEEERKSPKNLTSAQMRKSLIMDGLLYKTHHYISARETAQDQSRSLLNMYHPEAREFKIWGFSLGVLIRLFQRGWNVKHDVWGADFDFKSFEQWMQKSGELRKQEREGNDTEELRQNIQKNMSRE